MMKKLIIISILLLCSCNIYAQKPFNLVKEIDLSSLDFKKLSKITAEFRVNKKFIAKYKAIKLSDIINLCDNCFAEVEDSKGNLTYFSSSDLNTKLNNQVALLLYNSKFSGLGDTLVISEDELSKLEDNELLDIELGSVTHLSYALNSKDWDKAKKNKFFKANSIIFPFDNNTTRWIAVVKKIRIYKR